MRSLSTVVAVALFLSLGDCVLPSLHGTAHAAIVSGGFVGTIAGNTRDTYGLFGAVGADLSGASFTATFRYDTSAAFYSAQSTFDDYLGTGGVTLSVTIDQHTVATSGVTNTEIIDTQDGTDTEVTMANLAPAPLIDFVLFAQDAWAPGVTIDTPFTLDSTNFGQTIYVSADGNHYDVLDFVGTSTPDVPTPEPASLALLGPALAGISYARCLRVAAMRLAA